MLDESAEVTSGPTPAALPEFDMSQYEYTLVGVVVHSGSADCGHYYSFIKIRGCDEGKSSSTSSWYEFNDTVVTKFDEKVLLFFFFESSRVVSLPDVSSSPASLKCYQRLPDECFGGEEHIEAFDRDKQQRTMTTRNKNNNAYILVYQKNLPPDTRKESIDASKVSRMLCTSLMFVCLCV